MGHRVCPWWLGYFLISPLRRWRQNPAKILNGYARTGMTALEPAPAWAFSSWTCCVWWDRLAEARRWRFNPRCLHT